ncbi:hypothetical protein EVA_08534 [gut metagenome]|uniref:Uncharacterized protein n=1 Tax=gut metagenome TaxID=749906 RepID=J9G919_9ZZZZ
MERIRTNHFSVEIRWDQFLEDYDLFKLVYEAVDYERLTSIYRKLEGVCPNSAVYAFDCKERTTAKGEIGKHRIFLFASDKAAQFSKAVLQELLKSMDIIIREICTPSAAEQEIYPRHFLNLLLSLLPNRNRTLSYAHGKLICGTCSSVFNKGRKAGEELGLQLVFEHDHFFTAHTLTFAETDKVETHQRAHSLAYHLEFDEQRIYFSTKSRKGSKEYYHHPSVFRKDKKNRIPFLDFSCLHHFEESQGFILDTVFQEFWSAYARYLSYKSVVYDKPLLLESKNTELKQENLLLQALMADSWLDVRCHTTQEGGAQQCEQVVRCAKEVLRKLFGKESDDFFCAAPSKQRLCIRLVGDKKQEEKLSLEVRKPLDKRRLTEKWELIEKGVPTQDIMLGSTVDEPTLKNLFRQLLIKECCLKETLPRYMIERFKGCLFTYAEKKVQTEMYYLVQLSVQEDGEVSYQVYEPQVPYHGALVLWNGQQEMKEYCLPSFRDGYKNDSFYCVEKGGTSYMIYDTCEFVFPEMEEMHRSLKALQDEMIPVEAYRDVWAWVQSEESKTLCRDRLRDYPVEVPHRLFYSDFSKLDRSIPREERNLRNLMRLLTNKWGIKKGQDFRTKSRREETLAACVNVHYWKQHDHLWKYCAGPNTDGNFQVIHHKVYIRDLVCDGTADEAFIHELISSLGDGWNRIHEFSVHPSVFKFMKERLEMYKVKEQLGL